MKIEDRFGNPNSEDAEKILKLQKEVVRLKKDLKKAIDKNYKGVPVIEFDKGRKPSGEYEEVISRVEVFATDDATFKLAKKVESTTAALGEYLTMYNQYYSIQDKVRRLRGYLEAEKREVERLRNRGFWDRVFNR